MASRLIVLLLSAALTAGLGTVAAAQQTPPEQPLTRLPYEPSLNPAAMDRTADACVDFYQYSCGGWLRDNPIPDDQSSWDVYRRATVANQRYLWGILDGLSHQEATRTATEQQVGDYFAACMDESAIERRGSAPLAVRLAAIDALRDLRGLPVLLADLHLATPTNALFDFSASQDLVDSSQVIAFAQAGGLGLPDRDYYTRQDDKSVELRRQYVAQMVRVFGLLGDSEAQATRAAAQVLQLETSLARASLTRVERRDPRKLLHRMDLAALQRLTGRLICKRWGQDRCGALTSPSRAFCRCSISSCRLSTLPRSKPICVGSTRVVCRLICPALLLRPILISTAAHCAAYRHSSRAGSAVCSGWTGSWVTRWGRSLYAVTSAPSSSKKCCI